MTATTICSSCSCRVVLDSVTGVARAGGECSDVFHDENDLLMWDCPVCGYADSYSAVSA